MTPGLWLTGYGILAFLGILLAIINQQIGKMSGGKLKYLEESDSNLADKLASVFPLKEEWILVGRLLVALVLSLAVFCLGKWAMTGGNMVRIWIPLSIGCGSYWVMEMLVSLLGTLASAKVIMAFVPLLTVSSWLLFLFTAPYGKLSRYMGMKRKEQDDDVKGPTVDDEILSLLDGEAASENVSSMQTLEEDEKRMIRGALELDELSVRKIMTPRVDVECVEYNEGMPLVDFVAEARRVIVESGHSRIPVFTDSIDNIIGIVYSKDLLDECKVKDFKALVRKNLLVIPESKNIGDLLEEFRQSKIHLAIVVDEYGGTAGIVTFEDVLETLVGDIQDEYDYAEDDNALTEVEQGVWQCDAKTTVGVVNRVMKTEIPEDEEYDTIGGYVTAFLGKIPVQDEKIKTPALLVTICKADSRHVIEVELAKATEN